VLTLDCTTTEAGGGSTTRVPASNEGGFKVGFDNGLGFMGALGGAEENNDVGRLDRTTAAAAGVGGDEGDRASSSFTEALAPVTIGAETPTPPATTAAADPEGTDCCTHVWPKRTDKFQQALMTQTTLHL
jgi:hypothetical protein